MLARAYYYLPAPWFSILTFTSVTVLLNSHFFNSEKFRKFLLLYYPGYMVFGLVTALFTKPPVSRFTVVLNQNMRLRMRVHAKRTELADVNSQCRHQRSRTRSLVREKAAVQNNLLGSFCMAALHRSLFLLDGFRT